MNGELPTSNPEKKDALDDNARKFIVKSIDSRFLAENNATSYTLVTDWLTTDVDFEEKLAHKTFENGNIQILLISKQTTDGDRTSIKEKITTEKYTQLLGHSILRLQKERHEFIYNQNDTPFSIVYDEFTDSNLRIIEVDAANEQSRNMFSPDDFPSTLTEVTGNINYYGYRVANIY